jgi:hypothetical protein
MTYTEPYNNLKAKIKQLYSGELATSAQVAYLDRVTAAFPQVKGMKWWWVYQAMLERTELEAIYRCATDVGIVESRVSRIDTAALTYGDRTESVITFKAIEACDHAYQNALDRYTELSRTSSTTFVERTSSDSHGNTPYPICRRLLACAASTKQGQAYIQQSFSTAQLLKDISLKSAQLEKLLHDSLSILELLLVEEDVLGVEPRYE